MPLRNRSSKNKGQLALLTLRDTRDKLIRQYERSKYVDQIDALQAALKKYEGEL